MDAEFELEEGEDYGERVLLAAADVVAEPETGDDAKVVAAEELSWNLTPRVRPSW